MSGGASSRSSAGGSSGGTGSTGGSLIVVGGVLLLVFLWPRIQGVVLDRLRVVFPFELVERIAAIVPYVLAVLIAVAVLALVMFVVRLVRSKKRDRLVAALSEPMPRSWHETGQVKVGWIPFSWRLASVAVTYPSGVSRH